MKTIFTNLQVSTSPEMTIGNKDRLHELHREALFVREESHFFIRLLDQSGQYSSRKKRSEIDQLRQEFSEFLSQDQTDMERMLKNELDSAFLPEERPTTGILQQWKTFGEKFRKLKNNAMVVIGDFFVVRFQ